MNSDLLREAKEEKLHRLMAEQYRKYIPIGKFKEFVDKSMGGENKVNLFEAANGVGKTFGMTNLLANLFWPANNKNFQQKLFQYWPFSKRGRIISTSNAVTETIIPTLKQVFPKDKYDIAKYETTKEGKRYEAHWKIKDTDWEFTIMTYDQDPRDFESANLGWFWEDEPPSYQIHQANYSRLRMGGVGFVTETPLKGSQWIYDSFIDKTTSERTKEGKSFTHAVLEDACKEHGINGFMTHEEIEKQIAGYDKEELAPRVLGEHSHLSGRIFKKWTPEVHIIKPFNMPIEDWCWIEAVDTHPRTPDAVVWIAFNRNYDFYIVDELWADMTTDELALAIRVKEAGKRIIRRIIEPAAFIIDKHTGYQLAADLNTRYQLSFIPGSKNRQAATERITHAIDFSTTNDGQILNQPRLHSFNTNEHTNWEIGRWQWQDWRGLTAQFKNPKEKPVDKDEHMIECVGRCLLEDVKFEELEIPNPMPEWTHPMIKQEEIKKLDPYA